MGLFGSKKSLLQDGDFILIQTRVSNLELEIEKVKTHINSLRGLINRKLGQSEEMSKEEKIINADGLDDLRKYGKHDLSKT